MNIPQRPYPLHRTKKPEKETISVLDKSGKKWNILWPSPGTVIHSWQGPSNPSPFRPQTMPPTEKWSLSHLFFFDITSLHEVTYLGPFTILIWDSSERLRKLASVHECLLKESVDHLQFKE